MTGVKHPFTSAKADDADATLVNPSDWNAEHDPALTTKGDMIVRGAAVSARLPAGANGLALVADSGEALGVKYASVLRQEGSNLTEATTTSVTEVALLAVSGLSIPAATPFLVMCVLRKTAGAAAPGKVRVRLNATDVSGLFTWSSSADEADTGILWVVVGPRVTNYLRASIIHVTSIALNNVNHELFTGADAPSVAITDVAIRGAVDSTSITLGVDELRVYSLPV